MPGLATDVVVVGGGPAGLAAAVHARQAGMEVTVVEARHPPIDVACGEGLMPRGCAELSTLGIAPGSLPGRPLVGVRWLDADRVAAGRFGEGPGRGVRRRVLQRALAERADAVGVGLLWGTRCVGLRPDGIETDRGSLRARWVVGADGRRSRVRHWAGLDGAPPRRARFGLRRHVRVEPWSDHVEVYWGGDCEAYVTPVADDTVGVAILSGQPAAFQEHLASLPDLARRLRGCPAASRLRGAGPFGERARAVTKGRLALVGDAATCLDPITGEGLSLALGQARALVDAIRAGDLRRYEVAQRRQERWPRLLTSAVLLLQRRPGPRGWVVGVLAQRPALFGRLVSLAGGDSRVRPASAELPLHDDGS
jgi:flavin-dependent dehydrogenase